MKKTINSIAAMVQPIAGRHLEADWQQNIRRSSMANGHAVGGTYDKRDLESLWKMPNWSAKISADNVDNVMRAARLGVYGK
jgi:hypothetical protein